MPAQVLQQKKEVYEQSSHNLIKKGNSMSSLKDQAGIWGMEFYAQYLEEIGSSSTLTTNH
jgi:hypothetical protein